jgi:hypothetical protein
LNGQTTGSSPADAALPYTASGSRIGRGAGAGESLLGTIHEVYATTTPWNEAAVAALQASVMAKINQPVLATCPNDTLAVGTQGAEVYAAGTNYALQSQDIGTTWVLGGAASRATNTAVAPDGTTTGDSLTVTAAAPDNINQTVTGLTASSAYRCSGWLWTQSGVGTLCASRTNGVTWATATVQCQTVTTTPTRYSWDCSTGAAETQSSIVIGGENKTPTSPTAGTYYVWGIQLSPGLYPTPYIPTTTTAVTRAATVASVPLPDFSATDTACFGVTYTPGQDWNVNPATSKVLLGNYNAGSNAFTIDRLAGNLLFQVYDNAGANKIVTWAHGLGAVRTTKRIVGCMAAGTTALYVDGVSVGAVTGVGTALWSANQSPVYIGSTTAGGAFFLDGSISNVRIYPNATYRAGM